MIDDAVKELAKGANFAALTTLLPSGQPQTNVMWVDCDDEHVLINTEIGRQKFRDVEADPRVTVAIWDAANPYHYAEVRGRVTATVVGEEARSHLDEVSRRYTGGPYQNPIGSDRVILRITPERQLVR